MLCSSALLSVNVSCFPPPDFCSALSWRVNKASATVGLRHWERMFMDYCKTVCAETKTIRTSVLLVVELAGTYLCIRTALYALLNPGMVWRLGNNMGFVVKQIWFCHMCLLFLPYKVLKFFLLELLICNILHLLLHSSITLQYLL